MLSYAVIVEQPLSEPNDESSIANSAEQEKEKNMNLETRHALDYNYRRDPSQTYFKIQRTYYFGGMQKQIFIPLSTPDRVIIEPNPPRQGFSNSTWKGLNEYYLQKVLKKEEYLDILNVCKRIGFNVYTIYREESRFLKNSFFDKFCKFVWTVCSVTIAYMLVQEVKDEPDDILITYILVSISLALVLVTSIYNYF